MKTKRTAVVSVVLLGLLLSQAALAFYNPQTGRWLSRDPLGEMGFETLRSSDRDLKVLDGRSNPEKKHPPGGMTLTHRSRKTGSALDSRPADVFGLNNPISRIDVNGLDSPGCTGIGDVYDACRLECCARHDECYDVHDCSWLSWLNPFPCMTACGRCNLEVVACFIQCLAGYEDNPSRPNYYCCQCHVYFELDNPTDIHFPADNPHYGHHCD